MAVDSNNIRPVTLRRYDIQDEPAVWEIFRQVIQTGETYVIPSSTPRSQWSTYWLASYMSTWVASIENYIVGTYILKPNQIGSGNHIANASYMVHPKFQGMGIGKAMCEHSLEQARQQGYRGIQFNIVVSTNRAAIRLWERCGFEVIGITPGGFRHPEKGFVDTLIMFKSLLKNN